MKKPVLMFLLIATIIAAGLIAGHTSANRNTKRTKWPAATIISQQTEYGPNGEILSSTRIVRHQHPDGSWEQHTTNSRNGQSSRTTGRIDLSTAPTVNDYVQAAAETGRPETQLLGYRVFIQKNAREEFWYSPELDAVLKAVRYNDDGSISDVTEAVLITPR
jgi:hypothetical protein